MQEKFLDNKVARLVLRAPDMFKGKFQGNELMMVGRPQGSKVGAYEDSHVGGLIRMEDFDGLIDSATLKDPDFVPDEQLLIKAGLIAIDRRLKEEVKLALITGYIYAGQSINEAGWDTRVYTTHLPEKPWVSVDPQSSRTGWIPQHSFTDKGEDGEYKNTDKSLKMLDGHADMGRMGIAALDLIHETRKRFND